MNRAADRKVAFTLAKEGVSLFFGIYNCTKSKFPLKWKHLSVRDLFFLLTSNIFLSTCSVCSVSGLNFSGHLHLLTFNSCLRVWIWQTVSWHVLGSQGISLGNILSSKICFTLITFRSESKTAEKHGQGPLATSERARVLAYRCLKKPKLTRKEGAFLEAISLGGKLKQQEMHR